MRRHDRFAATLALALGLAGWGCNSPSAPPPSQTPAPSDPVSAPDPAPAPAPEPDPDADGNFVPPADPPPAAAPADPPLSAEDAELDQRIKKKFGNQCRFERRCGEMVGADCNAAADGPYYYLQAKTLEKVSTCGGACMMGNCTNCPPKGWNCPSY